ncbi:MAG: histidine triad nucleotide-binding protein [Endomicrobium sp.]|jgi:histidine triad (HIT) family protein|nr:histidine triad nucleotide-binding protein [Endomicrobium sp.]
MLNTCIFCEIISGRVSSDKVFDDDMLYAFRDVNPQSPVHIVIVPKKHISTLGEVCESDEVVLGHIQVIASKIAKEFLSLKNGFRVVSNCGYDGGQTVYHVHYHLLGGRVFKWPPG